MKSQVTVMNNVKSQKKNNEMENLEKVKANDKPPKSFSWWRFDDEYITGWQYLGRSIVSAFLALFLVGLYLNATTAYKRAKSLGNSDSSSRLFGVWGGLSLIIGLTPAAILNLIPNVYLWASNGHNPNLRK